MLTERRDNFNKLGGIGHLTGDVEDEYMFWNLVVTLRLPPSELDRWTLGEMRKATAVLDMKNDFSLAYQKLGEAGK